MTQQHRYPNTNIDASIVVDNQLVPVTVDVSTPPPGYVLWDWNAAITWVAKNKSEWVMGLGVQNIGNTRYRNYLNRQRFFADEMGRNIQVQLRYNF
jgi:iron complex outermembrane receptor protein